MTPTFWQGRRVFLTGHTGFKGGWLSLWLQSLGARVTGFALSPPKEPSLFNVARVAEGMESVIGDIRESSLIRRALNVARPEVVIHMAAQPLVRASYKEPMETYATNVMGTVHLLDAIRGVSEVRSVVVVTSDKCYENQEWVWGYRESEPLGGRDPYSSSKACAEIVTAAYRSSFFSNGNDDGRGAAVATARAGNVLGGGDWAEDRLVPDILAAFEVGKAVRIRNPHSIRPWQHVLEPLRGYLDLAERLHLEGATYAEAWNFGPSEEDSKTVEWIVKRMAQLWGGSANWDIDLGPHPHEATFLKLETSKARQRLGWKPLLDLPTALQMTIDWARERASFRDMRQVTLAQIHFYQALADRNSMS